MNTIIDFLKRFGFILFVVLMFITMTVVVAFSQTPPVEALELIAREQPKKAIELLRRAVENTPTAMTWYNLGNGLVRTGDLTGAKSAFEKGIALDEKAPLNYCGKGRILLKQGNLREARVQFDKALALTRSKNVEVLNAVAEAYLDNPQFVVSAMDLLNKAEAIEPNEATSLLLGDCYLLQGNGGKAVSNYEAAAILNVRDAAPHYKMGLVYIRSTNYEVALKYFQNAVSVDPTYTSAYKELAELYYQMKRGDEAVKAQEKYLSLTERPDAGRVRLAFYLFMTRDFARTNDVFEQAYQNGGLSETALRYYALSLLEAGEYSRAQKVFEEYFSKAKPEQIDESDYTNYGKVLLNLDQDSLAVIAFDKSLAIQPRQIAVLQLKAETLFKDKKYESAVVSYRALIAGRNKATSQDLYSLGRSQYYSNQFNGADSTFRKLIEAQPNMIIGYLWAGRANANLDPESETGLARPFYQQVIERGQQTPDKNKNELIEAYSYFGYYHFVKKEYAVSRSYWEQVMALDPSSEKAREALKAIKQ
jgi:tetratricopeptide (TPR) repeat protein